MPNTDYTSTSLTTVQMVKNRLYFLDLTDPLVAARINEFILEMMHELEKCFRVSYFDWNNTQNSTETTTPPWPDPVPAPGKVGHEEFYTVLMQALIADLVAINALMGISSYNSNQGGTGAGAGSIFMSKAKADVVEVEWKQLDAAVAGGLSSLRTSTADLLKYLTDSAQRKAAQMGCSILVCDLCQPGADIAGIMPFIVVSDCGCTA